MKNIQNKCNKISITCTAALSKASNLEEPSTFAGIEERHSHYTAIRHAKLIESGLFSIVSQFSEEEIELAVSSAPFSGYYFISDEMLENMIYGKMISDRRFNEEAVALAHKIRNLTLLDKIAFASLIEEVACGVPLHEILKEIKHAEKESNLLLKNRTKKTLSVMRFIDCS